MKSKKHYFGDFEHWSILVNQLLNSLKGKLPTDSHLVNSIEKKRLFPLICVVGVLVWQRQLWLLLVGRWCSNLQYTPEQSKERSRLALTAPVDYIILPV